MLIIRKVHFGNYSWIIQNIYFHATQASSSLLKNRELQAPFVQRRIHGVFCFFSARNRHVSQFRTGCHRSRTARRGVPPNFESNNALSDASASYLQNAIRPLWSSAPASCEKSLSSPQSLNHHLEVWPTYRKPWSTLYSCISDRKVLHNSTRFVCVCKAIIWESL